MMEVTLTCIECGSGINIHPDKNASEAICPICQKSNPVKFNEQMENGHSSVSSTPDLAYYCHVYCSRNSLVHSQHILLPYGSASSRYTIDAS